MAKTLTDDDLTRAFGELGISPTADLDAIAAARRARASAVHPDRNVSKAPGQQVDDAAMKRVNGAIDVLKMAAESGQLREFVAREARAWDLPEMPEAEDETQGSIPTTVEKAFPNKRDIVIVHRTHPGIYIVWMSGSIVANNASPRKALRVLREMAGEAADDADVLVWVFVPGVRKVLIQLRMLPAMLAQIEEKSTPSENAAPAREEAPAPTQATEEEEAPTAEDIQGAVAKEDWRGLRTVYVIHVSGSAERKIARVYIVVRVGRGMRATLIGSATSSQGAIQLLARRDVNADVSPVFVIHAADPGVVLRLGAA